MSLEVIDFKTRKVKYELEEGDYFLKPLYAVQQVEGGKKIKAVFDYLEEKVKNKNEDNAKKKVKPDATNIKNIINDLMDEDSTNKLIDLELDFMNFALEGDSKLTKKYFRQEIFERVVSDFFQQLRR